jgi:hypothetical protein
MNFITPAFERFLADNNITHRVEPRGKNRFRIVFDHSGCILAMSFQYKALASRKRRTTIINKLICALEERAA